jgi:hypothetical protein
MATMFSTKQQVQAAGLNQAPRSVANVQRGTRVVCNAFAGSAAAGAHLQQSVARCVRISR